MKTGRNAPCPCGSGKKFKKCCLQKEDREWAEWFARDLEVGRQNLERMKKKGR